MLILTRRIREKLVTGDNVITTKMGAKGSQIRIGIEALCDVQAHREEIYQGILKERKGLKREHFALMGVDLTGSMKPILQLTTLLFLIFFVPEPLVLTDWFIR